MSATPDPVAKFGQALIERGVLTADRDEGNPRTVASIASAIEPYVLPAALRHLWETVPVGALPFGDAQMEPGWTPYFDDPAVAWWAWRAARDRPGLMPVALMPVSVTGEVWRFVELEGEGAGGGVYECAKGGTALRRIFSSAEAWVDALAHRARDPGTPLLGFEAPYWMNVQDGPVEPGATGDVADRTDASTWPARWRHAEGAFAGRRDAPSVRAVGSWLGSDEDSGTVAGIQWPVDSTDAATRILLMDGTAILDLEIPASVKGHWMLDHETWSRRPFWSFEFDVSRVRASGSREQTSGPSHPPDAVAERLRLRIYG